MKLFRNDQTGASANLLAEKVAGYILERQARLAVLLNQKLEKLSPNTVKLSLTGFLSVFSAYCLYLLINAFY